MSIFSDDIDFISETWNRVKENISRVIVGMDKTLEEMFIALIANGHVLIEGPPGTAKTTLAKEFSRLLGLEFSRIQFTPDLLPSDIIGTKIYDPNLREFITHKGPIFANLILADEINRAGPKTQSALLEAMQEKQVTIEGDTYKLPDPFMVIATQNPIEVEGTYPLPSAQLDRFLIKTVVEYPSAEDYIEIIRRFSGYKVITTTEIIDREQVRKMQEMIDKVKVSDDILNYIASLINAVREDERVEWGISPRGGIYLTKAAKAWALMNGRDYVVPEDIKRVFNPVINHRIILKPDAVFRGIKVSEVLDGILRRVQVPL